MGFHTVLLIVKIRFPSSSAQALQENLFIKIKKLYNLFLF